MGKRELTEDQRYDRKIRVAFSWVTILFETAYTATAFNTLLLQKQGFSSTQVGVILAVFSIIGIIAPPFWGYLADRIRSIPKAFITVLCIQGVSVAFLPIINARPVKISGVA